MNPAGDGSRVRGNDGGGGFVGAEAPDPPAWRQTGWQRGEFLWTPASDLMESERFPAVMGKFTLVVDLGGKLQLQRRLARLPSKVEGS